MYFRTKKIKSSRLVQLVESFRDAESRPRQRVVVSLGNVELPAGEEKLIAEAVERRLYLRRDNKENEDQMMFFGSGLSEVGTQWVDRIMKLAERSKWAAPVSDFCGDETAEQHEQPEEHVVAGVIIERIENENVVDYGAELVGMAAWNDLKIGELLVESGMSKRSVALAQTMVINRLVCPLSEWALIEWAERSALPECLDIRLTRSGKDVLYRTSDELLKRRKTIESHLRDREKDLFSLQRNIVLYDVTNTHFEGQCEANPKAARGKNKQKRNDCLQVAIGVVYDAYGFALAHEVFEGNMSDTKTLEGMLSRLDRDGFENALVILDAGFASRENIDFLKKAKRPFLVNVTRGSRNKYKTLFDADDYTSLPGRDEDEQVEVKLCADPDIPDENLVLCRSQKRREKEVSMISQAEKRFVKDAEALRSRVARGQLKEPDKICIAIGRLKQKHPRAARFYKVECENGEIVVRRDDERINDAIELCGDYVLRTDRNNLSAEEIWNLYMTLLKAEAGFRMLKGTLGLRPNFHHKEKRVDGHIFISMIAYHLLCWIQAKLVKSGDTREWKTIRRILRTHCLLTTRMPTINGQIISVRKPGTPDEDQLRIYRSLGIDYKSFFKTKMMTVNINKGFVVPSG